MTETELIKEIAAAFGQGALTVVPLLLWLRDRFEKMRANWIADLELALHKKMDEKIADTTKSTRDELDSIKIRIHKIEERVGLDPSVSTTRGLR